MCCFRIGSSDAGDTHKQDLGTEKSALPRKVLYIERWTGFGELYRPNQF